MRARRLQLLVVAAVAVTLGAVLVAVAASSEGGRWKLVLVAVALGLPGAFAATRHPSNSVGWLLLAIASVFSAMVLASQLTDAGITTAWGPWLVDRAGAVVVPLVLLVLVLLPDGRLPSSRWRPLVAVVVAVQLVTVLVWSLVEGDGDQPNPVGVLPPSWAGVVNEVGDWVLQAPFLVAVVAVVVRLQRGDDRAGLVWALGGAAGFAVLAVAGHVLVPGAADALDVLGALALGGGLTVTLTGLPGAVAEEVPAVPVPGANGVRDLSLLSAREREVLSLVAEGLTNRQIADRLFISPVTARNHVSSILTKLGLENRTQAAAWLARGPQDR